MLPKGLYDHHKIRQANQLRNAGYKVAKIAEILEMTQEAVRLATYDSESASNNRSITEARKMRRAAEQMENVTVNVTPYMRMVNERRAARIVSTQMIAEGFSRGRVADFFDRWLRREE